MTAPSHRQRGESDARAMLLLISCFLATAAAAPATTYNRQQNGGELNLQADIQDIVIIVGLPKNISGYHSVFDYFLRNSRRGNADIRAQDRSDTQVMDAFVEPQTPYQVDIGDERSAGGDGSAREAEVVIPSRRRLDAEPLHGDEIKLIGATEQCGPDRERDPVTLMCRFRVDAVPENTPEVVPASV